MEEYYKHDTMSTNNDDTIKKQCVEYAIITIVMN